MWAQPRFYWKKYLLVLDTQIEYATGVHVAKIVLFMAYCTETGLLQMGTKIKVEKQMHVGAEIHRFSIRIKVKGALVRFHHHSHAQTKSWWLWLSATKSSPRLRDQRQVCISFPDLKNKSWIWIQVHHPGEHKGTHLSELQEISLGAWCIVSHGGGGDFFSPQYESISLIPCCRMATG